MRNKLQLTTCAVVLTAALSGCSESATLDQGVDSFNNMVNEVTRGLQKGVQEGLGGSAKSTRQTSTQNTTDWTPYLSPMQNGCNYPNLMAGIPTQYKGAVRSIDKEENPIPEGKEEIYTYHLTNSTAFGYPIQKLEYLQGYEWSRLKITFNNDDFTALRSSFKAPNTNGYPLAKNDASGYLTDYYTYLKFDTADNSIACGS